ncbi:MAG: imidazole glycerol phosphate synthase cyclase subunit [Candidatus Paceibacterota bacterium]|jgi:cyclase
MLSKRIIASLIVKDGIVVQSVGFKKYLPIGSPEIAVEFLNQWGADEIVVVDIEASRENRTLDLGLLARLADKSMVPLTVGGGINSVETIRQLIRMGADKVVINRAAIEHPELIHEAARIFGNQCVVVSIDAKEVGEGRYEAFTDSGRTGTGKDPVEVARSCAAQGAGEIFIRSIDRDGSKKGFDTELIRRVSEAVDIPVVAAGGCGHPQHIADAFQNGHADAVAVGNSFHFTEHSVTIAKAFLKSDFPIRLDTYATYAHTTFDDAGRLAKQDDAVLEKLRFEYHPKEVI